MNIHSIDDKFKLEHPHFNETFNKNIEDIIFGNISVDTFLNNGDEIMEYGQELCQIHYLSNNAYNSYLKAYELVKHQVQYGWKLGE